MGQASPQSLRIHVKLIPCGPTSHHARQNGVEEMFKILQATKTRKSLKTLTHKSILNNA